MATFIKIASGHFVNVDRIAVIADRAKVSIGSERKEGSELRFGQGFMFYASETPEQILALINAAQSKDAAQ